MFTKPFKQISKDDASIAGGKGASLGEMINAGIPVPDGFVVLSTTFDKFLEITDINIEIDAILKKVKHNEVHTVENASKQIQALILKAEMPKEIVEEIKVEFKRLGSKYVAVRSSATAEDSASAAWAGQLDSFLNTTESTLLENVQRCFASLFTPRAIFYRFEKELHNQKISVAVVVQKMVNSDVSGIAFSVHPVTEDRNQIIIEAGFGLGEAIVSGQITPDSYVVTKNDLNILDKNVYTQERGIFRDNKNGGNEWKNILETEAKEQCLSDKQIIELSKIIINIENHYNFPCDIEWAMEGDRFYIVQSRPITTLKNVDDKNKNSADLSDDNKIILSKWFSREYSLLQIVQYCQLILENKEKTGYSMDHELFFYNSSIKMIEVYHSLPELEGLFKSIGGLAKSPGFVEKVVFNFNQSLKELIPYFEGYKKTSNISEFRKLYDLFFEFYRGNSYVWVLPLLDFLPESDKKMAMACREATERYSSDRDAVLINNLKILFPSLGDLVRFMLPEEVFSGKINNVLLKELKERSLGFIYYKNRLYQSANIKDFFNDHNLETEKYDISGNQNEIKGVVAEKGVVKGQAKLIFTANDFNKIEEGNIIVSPMTRPEFLPIMKKARAFVTDEGGVTCHAAIVSRELGKPCIISTKIATQILKDGDEIEVDADNGLVRILNKKSDSSIDIKKFKESIKDREYITQQGDISIALLGNICNAIQKEYISVYGYSHVQPILTMQKGTHGICYFDLEMYRDFSRVSYSRIKNSVYNLLEYKDYQKLSEIIDNEYKNFFIPEDIVGLKERVSNYFELAKKYLVSTLYCEAVDHQIVRELAEKSKVKNIEKFVEISILPTKPSFVSHQNQLLLDNVDISWSFTNYFVAPTIKERLKLLNKKRKEINRKEIEKEIKKTRQIANNNQKLVDKLLRESSVEQKRVIEFVQASINIRDERKEFILKLFTILSDSLRFLAEKFNISYDLISTMADNEIERLGENSFFEILQERSEKGVAMISSSDKPLISAIDYNLFKSIVFDQSNKSDSVNGICANKGFYKGKVKIIVSEKDFHQFQDGEVLITGMTRAEYVPLMRKAGAIVTDEGGVTCHAAIVSRELGKPCVIGTRIATQVLKDGDEVEVDAGNGVVKILKRKSENGDMKWIKTFSRKHSLQRMSFLWPYFKTGLIQDEKIKLNNLLVLPNEDRYDYYVKESEWNDCLEKLSKHLLKDSVVLQKKYFENLAEKFLSVSKKVYNADLKKWTDKKMSNWFKNFLKIYSLYSWYVFTPFSLESKIYPELLEKLNKKYPKKVNEYLEIISTPIKNNQLLEQQLDLLKISLLENKDKELDKHIKKYFWIPVNNINDNSWDKKYFLEQIKQFKDAKSEIKKRKEDLKDRKKNFDQFLKKIKSNKDIYNLSKLINFYVSLRDDSRDIWRQVLCYINPFYIEISRRANLRKDGSLNMLNEEIFDFLESGKIPKDLSKRDKRHAVSFKDGDLKIIVNDLEIKDLQRNLLKSNLSLELKGFSAYKGVVSGRVRLIKNKEDLKSLQDGEILVSHHTSPDYLLAMKKSIAFVTDEGGVTSHAAIIARELKIPCITATVNASSILKTGDEVEVDADNGVVRILKRK